VTIAGRGHRARSADLVGKLVAKAATWYRAELGYLYAVEHSLAAG
jgi:hypothetical protein